MQHAHEHHQTKDSVSKNSTFFREHRHDYDQNVQELDTYRTIRAVLNESLQGIDLLNDMGNGGVFDYDTSAVKRIVAVDLFLDALHDPDELPRNATLCSGSALQAPIRDESCDGVLMVMLLHHVVAESVAESLKNVHQVISEAVRMLKPGGRLIIIESCVPGWFYTFERLVYRLVTPIINLVLPHPATLQYPAQTIEAIVAEHGFTAEVLPIPKGHWVLQYGFRWPGALTPVQPYRFIVRKPA